MAFHLRVLFVFCVRSAVRNFKFKDPAVICPRHITDQMVRESIRSEGFLG